MNHMIEQLSLLRKDFYHSRAYIIAAFIIFIVSIVVGYQWEAFHAFLHSQIQGIAEVAEQLAEAENPMLQMFTFIFFNNTIKAIAIIYLGLFLGVLPIFFLAVNGMVLGYLYLQMVVVHEAATLWDIVIGILPHGIIELPVVIIACGFGLKLGALVWKKLIQLISNQPRINGEIRSFMKGTGRIVFFLVVTLLIAAIIESTITPWLLGI